MFSLNAPCLDDPVQDDGQHGYAKPGNEPAAVSA